MKRAIAFVTITATLIAPAQGREAWISTNEGIMCKTSDAVGYYLSYTNKWKVPLYEFQYEKMKRQCVVPDRCFWIRSVEMPRTSQAKEYAKHGFVPFTIKDGRYNMTYWVPENDISYTRPQNCKMSTREQAYRKAVETKNAAAKYLASEKNDFPL